MNDVGRGELAERDREYLVAELTSAVGLGGCSCGADPLAPVEWEL